MTAQDPAFPSTGPDLGFDAFTQFVVAGVRRRLPCVVVTRRGRLIVFRHGAEAMTIDHWTAWRDSAQRRVMLSIGERRDRFVAENVAVTMAGALTHDAAWSA